jgi:hypothetical protein
MQRKSTNPTSSKLQENREPITAIAVDRKIRTALRGPATAGPLSSGCVPLPVVHKKKRHWHRSRVTSLTTHDSRVTTHESLPVGGVIDRNSVLNSRHYCTVHEKKCSAASAASASSFSYSREQSLLRERSQATIAIIGIRRIELRVEACPDSRVQGGTEKASGIVEVRGLASKIDPSRIVSS